MCNLSGVTFDLRDHLHFCYGLLGSKQTAHTNIHSGEPFKASLDSLGNKSLCRGVSSSALSPCFCS